MLKIKGLKKKKGHKKHKRKDDDLFKPEELEAYRKEHEAAAASTASLADSEQKPAGAENEEWRKFLALTSGVDDVLKKTQGDLDRIKSTSFFQRVPPPSEVRQKEEEKRKEVEEELKAEEESKAEEKRIEEVVKAAIVEVSDTESEEEAEDDIFDTAYIDAIAAGEVKLAYIPESPTDQTDEDDPFDTAYAEKAILGPNAERKGKKLVPLGAAVEILTGRVQAPTCAPIKRPVSSKRQIFKEKDLLLGSFDANANPESVAVDVDVKTEQTTLLDEDAPEELASEPIDLSKVIITPSVEHKAVEEVQEKEEGPKTDILEEFDVLAKTSTPEDDDDKEFALLAAESLAKSVPVLQAEQVKKEVVAEEKWNAFGDHNQENTEEEVDADPFDTTFAENILPGETELKLIEKEILNSDNDFDFNPRASESYTEIIRQTVSIQLTNPSGQRESLSSLDRVAEEDLNSLRPIHRDLLGGSNTDLSQLGDQPLKPKDSAAEEEEDQIEYSDPFDTSAIDAAALPGTTELKFLERELLDDIKETAVATTTKQASLSDDEFDPRAFDQPPPITRKVSFDLPLNPKQDLLGAKDEEYKVTKPLTPYYERKDSIAEEVVDPFDTSFAENLKPGPSELKQIENELFNNEIEDEDFNPRDDKQVAVAKVVQSIQALSQPKVEKAEVAPPVDLLSTVDDLSTKVLTPADINKNFEEDSADIDPFDTSIAANILPGATELKLLESELITNSVEEQQSIKRNLTDPEFDPRILDEPDNKNKNLLEEPTVDSVKPLTPVTSKVSFDIDFEEEVDDIDPFDTSIANNIGPGPSELKLLESELI